MPILEKPPSFKVIWLASFQSSEQFTSLEVEPPRPGMNRVKGKDNVVEGIIMSHKGN